MEFRLLMNILSIFEYSDSDTQIFEYSYNKTSILLII